jgi:ADP-heptose:LPS heptosyltransferase
MTSLRQKILNYVSSTPALRPMLTAWGNFKDSIKLHLDSFSFVLRVVLPLILRTRKRPVLFSRYVGMGDIICTFPAALELMKRHPGATFIYSCHLDFACLPKMGGVAQIVAPVRASILQKWWAFLFADIYQFEYGDEKQSYASTEILIEAFGRQHDVKLDGEHPRLQIDDDVRAKMQSLLDRQSFGKEPVVLIHPGPSWPVREWPRDAWGTLALELQHHGFHNIIQVGIGKHLDAGIAEPYCFAGVISMVDRLTLEESIALISLCDLLVGIDSGLLHIAACTRTPSIGIFGPTTPDFRFSAKSSCSFVVSTVECQGCHHRLPCLHWITGCPYDIKCMKTISTQEVLQACLKKLPGVEL